MNVPRSVLVTGTGLIGTSVALALRARGVAVQLFDTDPEALRLARDRGAGEEWRPGEPVDLAVIAVPPHSVAEVLARLQASRAARCYTDVASVKVVPIREARQLGCDLVSYVPGHPMAGRETSGPLAAHAGLFSGRPWVLCPTGHASQEALAMVRQMVSRCGGRLVELDAAVHDKAVALVSHAPHVVAAAMAAQLADSAETTLGLAGQGLRDMTRIAGGDPVLWADILAGNASAVAETLDAVAHDLTVAAASLRATGDRITSLLERGAHGRSQIPPLLEQAS
ncbi:prephenate dehydrogenase/arogenate dehydrogenase family protein [Herbidospora sp. NEAU-GS84]|uniref:Prephenate dehydrogenase/arogenate dehydrogenase family protein n=1 Tax=Herbidospora solisilvae TaxID=2696284 RepID=A0A7C9N0P8_9ACTN|nr:prephenate dehydrogenase [Herbidospora solisilvae]NAS25951.1 prephenate dehydrogenase/arogenate dehydrogenase family protein [Herbidospora solisilvae]